MLAENATGTESASPTPTYKPHRHVPHFASIPNEPISFLTPYSGLLVSLWIVLLFLIKRYILELFIFPRCYNKVWRSMDDGNKRGFIVHHISAVAKIGILIVGVKPFVDVVFGKSALHDGYTSRGPRPTMGDVLLVLSQGFCGLYMFELLVRKSPSPIAVAHHIGAVLIAQSAIVLSLQLEHQTNATMEFVLCVVWGAFDVLSELWLNIAFIVYRLRPENHSMLANVFLSTCVVSVTGTIAETCVIMTLFGQAWHRWELAFKVVTPILHILFTIAQLHCAKILWHMWRKEKRLMTEQHGIFMDPERANKVEAEGKTSGVITEESAEENSIGRSTIDPPPTKPRSNVAAKVTKLFSRR